MMSTQNNNIQNIAAPQPVFVQVMPAPMFNFAPVLQTPQLADLSAATPLPIFTPPMPLMATPTLTPISNVSSSTPIMFYDGSTVSNVPSYLTPTINQGVLTPPQGYSFATIDFNPLPIFTPPMPLMATPTLTPISNVSSSTPIMFYDGSTVSNVPSYLTPTINQGVLTPPQGYSFATIDFNPLPVLEETESTGNVEDLSCSSSEPTPEPVAPKPITQKPRKFKHGSKQEKIMEVYNRIQEKYTAQGVYAGEHEVLRGADTVRVHVKTFKGLDKIEAALQEVDDCPDVQLRKLATPFSMKNRFQKKGFIVYLRLISPDMVDSVKAVFKKYEEFFRKCDVAMPKPTDPHPTEPVDSKISDFLDADKGKAPFFPLPLPMLKQSSVPSDAA